MEAAQQEVAKMSPGAVVVTGMKFRGGTAREKFLDSDGNHRRDVRLGCGEYHPASHIGKHDPTSDLSETYNRIKGYFTTLPTKKAT